MFKFFIYQLIESFFFFWNHRYITVKTNSTDQRNFSNLIFTSNYHHNELICSWKKIKRTTHNEYLEHQASISTIFIRANYITKREMPDIWNVISDTCNFANFPLISRVFFRPNRSQPFTLWALCKFVRTTRHWGQR